MKKLALSVLALAMLVGCGASEKTGKVEKVTDGETLTVEVTVKGEEITALTIDETKGGVSKRELGLDYGMKGVSAKMGKIENGGEWFEQMDALQAYIVENGLQAVKDQMGADGYPTGDLTSGCTINLYSYVAAIEEAVAAAE